jgi:hypothetical protein
MVMGVSSTTTDVVEPAFGANAANCWEIGLATMFSNSEAVALTGLEDESRRH